MSTTTTNLGLTKPAIGDSGWGTTMNTNLDTVDTALGNVYRTILLDEPVQVVNAALLDTVSTYTWTDLDLTSVTSANADWVSLYVDLVDTGTGATYIGFRKNGSTNAHSYVGTHTANVHTYANIAHIPMDSGQVIEVSTVATGTNTLTAVVYVTAYGERVY